MDTYTTDDYAVGYMDAVNGEVNLTAYDTSNSYHAGYEDALHDMEFTVDLFECIPQHAF